MKLALYTNENVSSGGGYQTTLTNLKYMLANLPEDIKVTIYTSNKILSKTLTSEDTIVKYIKISKLHYIWFFIRHQIMLIASQLFPGFNAPAKFIERLLGETSHVERVMLQDEVDLVYFLSPEPVIVYFRKINYIMTIWDLAYLDHNYLPELKASYTFETRDSYYRRAIRKSYRVVVDSSHTKQLINTNYGYPLEKLIEIPFSPSSNLTYSNLQNLNDEDFIFYPAQYWPHKNHKYILDALKIINDGRSSNIKAIFTGTDKGFKSNIIAYASEIGVQDQVDFKGFVSYDELSSLYSYALCVVMPSFIGPTNIPPLEALRYNTSCIYTGWPENREYFGDAVRYCDLSDPNTLASEIINLKNPKNQPKNSISTDEFATTISNKAEYTKLAKSISDLKYYLQCLS